jgi:uncharacterized protein YrrD
MELKEGSTVFTFAGEQVGRINRFVLDPATNEVTHIVVEKGWLLPEDKVVPIDMVNSATEERVVLNEDPRDFEQLPPFEETHYVELTQADIPRVDDPIYSPAYYWYPPTGYIGSLASGPEYYAWQPVETQRNIPADTVPLKEGARVMSSDEEHVGDVERLFLDSESHRATHLLISQGLLFKERRSIPMNWVRSVEEDEVHLWVPARVLERLPAFES